MSARVWETVLQVEDGLSVGEDLREEQHWVMGARGVREGGEGPEGRGVVERGHPPRRGRETIAVVMARRCESLREAKMKVIPAGEHCICVILCFTQKPSQNLLRSGYFLSMILDTCEFSVGTFATWSPNLRAHALSGIRALLSVLPECRSL